MNNINKDLNAVLDFWFSKSNQSKWFIKDDLFDNEIKDKFYAVWQQATFGELADWRHNALGRLAEIIVLDQFSRNLMRNDGRAFAQDGMALVLAQEAIKQSDYEELSEVMKKFTIMPFMHSESAKIQAHSVQLFAELGDAGTLKYAQQHKQIIDRFGRYPHRNEVLNRKTTDAEKEFLKQPGSSF